MKPLYDGAFAAGEVTTEEVQIDTKFNASVWCVTADAAGTLSIDLFVGGSVGWMQVRTVDTPAAGAGDVPLGYAEVMELPGRLRARWTAASGTGNVLVGVVFR